jgi:hypothetical protein
VAILANATDISEKIGAAAGLQKLAEKGIHLNKITLIRI